MTRQEQTAFLEQQGLRMGSVKEGVEALVAQQIGIAHANERIYKGLSEIAEQLSKPMLSTEVVAEWDRRELQKIVERMPRLSTTGLVGFEDNGPEGLGLLSRWKP